MSIREFRRVRRLSHGIVPLSQVRRVLRIRDSVDKSEGLKYLVVSNLKLRHMGLEHRGVSKRGDSLLLDFKLDLLLRKIVVLETSHQARDYVAVRKLVDEIEVELRKWGL